MHICSCSDDLSSAAIVHCACCLTLGLAMDMQHNDCQLDDIMQHEAGTSTTRASATHNGYLALRQSNTCNVGIDEEGRVMVP